MNFWNLIPWNNGAQPPAPPPPQPQIQQIQVPQFVKDNVYLAVSGGLALIRGPMTLIVGGAGAVFCQLVRSDTVPSQTKPLADRMVEVIQPVIEAPMTVPDMVALCACMMFDDFAPFATAWIGFSATLYILTKQRQE